MAEHRSFMPTDFALRDIPGFLIGFTVVSALCIFAGLTLQALPPFWGGMLCGIGVGFFSALALLHEKREIAVASLPEPSTAVRAKCDAPACSLAEAVKMYCDETGLSLSEGTAALRAYTEKKPLRD